MQLIPIKKNPDENIDLLSNPLCQDILYMTLDFYKKVTFVPPWIGYFAKQDDKLVGSAGFKGPPINGTVEIAYGTEKSYSTRILEKNMFVFVGIVNDPEDGDVWEWEFRCQ